MAKKRPGMMAFVRAAAAELSRKARLAPHERRARARYGIILETDVAVLVAAVPRQQVGGRSPAYIRNVSRTGVGLLCQASFAKGEVIGVRLTSSLGLRRVWATVVRCDERCSFVEGKMLPLNDVGAAFCQDYKPLFVKGLRTGDRATQGRLTALLTELKDPLAEDILLGFVDAKDCRLRGEVIHALGEVGAEASARAILPLLASDALWRVPADDPLHPVLAPAGLLRDPSRLPREGPGHVVLDMSGEVTVITIAQEPDGRFVATCTGPGARHAEGTTRAEALNVLRDKILRRRPTHDGRIGSAGAADYVFARELAADALRKITGLDLPSGAGAAPERVGSQRQAWSQQVRAWLKGHRAAPSGLPGTQPRTRSGAGPAPPVAESSEGRDASSAST